MMEFDEELSGFYRTLEEIEGLLNDFNRDVSSYLDQMSFDDVSFYEVERRLDIINNLKSKYGQSIQDILAYKESREKKLETINRFDEKFQEAKEKLKKAEKNLDVLSNELSKIRKEYSKDLREKIIKGLKDLNFLDVNFEIHFEEKKTVQKMEKII